MPSRIDPVKEAEASDADLKQLLSDGRQGWWEDAEMFGFCQLLRRRTYRCSHL